MTDVPLFDELYSQAWNREHVVLADIRRLQHLNPSLVSLGRLSRGLRDAHQDFEADLKDIAERYKIPFPPDPKCPDCNDPDCPGAAPPHIIAVPMGFALLKKLLGQ